VQDNGNLSLLESLGIKPSYMDLYVGLEKGWINKEQILNFFYRYEDKSNSDLIAKISGTENENLLQELKPLIERVYGYDNFEDYYRQGERRWRFAYLFSALTSHNKKSKISKKILGLRKLFSHTESWNDFIHTINYYGAELVDFDKLSYFLAKEEKELFFDYINPEVKKKLKHDKEFRTEKFFLDVMSKFYFLSLAGYKSHFVSFPWGGLGISFESMKLRQRITIVKTDNGFYTAHFSKKAMFAFKKYKTGYLDDLLKDNKEYRYYFTGEFQHNRFNNIASFIKYNLKLVVDGKKWFDKL
jgi:hypothetical protein